MIEDDDARRAPRDQRDGAPHADRVGRLPQHDTLPSQSRLKSAARRRSRAHKPPGRPPPPTRRSSRSRRVRAPGSAASEPVHRDDRRRQRELGRHRRETRPPRPRRSRLTTPPPAAARSAPPPPRSRSRRPAARQRNVGRRVHHHQGVGGADRVRRDDDWPKKWLFSGDPSSAQRRGPVRPPPRSTSGPRSRQYRGCPSRQSGPTPPRPADHHLVPDSHIANTNPNGGDDPGTLVAEHARRRERHVAVTRDRVGIAHAGRHDLSQRLARPRRINLHLGHRQRAEQLLENCRGSAHRHHLLA